MIGQLFGARGWHDTAFGEAHRDFHGVLTLFDKDYGIWVESADRFRDAMAEAISARPHEMRCNPAVPQPRNLRKVRATDAPKPIPTKRRIASL